MFKSVLTAAVVAAVVAAGSVQAASWINGRSIKPHSIPLNRLAHRPVGKQGPVGLQGPRGLTGPQGPQGIPGDNGYGIERTRLATKDECPFGGMAVLFDWPFIPPYAVNSDPDSFYWHICNGAETTSSIGYLCVGPGGSVKWGGGDGMLCDSNDTKVKVATLN